MDYDDVETLKRWVGGCAPGRMVFFGGAGVSTESGIPDFRSADGLCSLEYSCPPEQMISRSFFYAHPDEFFRFYFDRMVATDAKPNAAIRAIADADFIVVAGTSLVAYPAAGLLRYFQGKHLAIVNLGATPADHSADLCIQAKVGEVFSWL